MKTMLRPIVLATAAALTTPMVAQAELSANAAATSNYIWRGVTQSNDQAAVSGGVDFANSGFYAGVWASNLSGSEYELDLYGGYSGEVSGFGYDVGIITYQYPVSSAGDFEELYFNGSYKMFSFGLAYTVGEDASTGGFNKGDLYIHAGAEFEIKKDVTLGVTIGNYDFDDDINAEDYTHFQLALSKGDFSLSLDKNDLTDSGSGEDNLRVAVTWSSSFDL